MSEKIFDSHSFFLFSMPTFLKGIGEALDMSGSSVIFNESKTEVEADCLAISNDWYVVGKDLQKSIDIYKQSNNVK